MEAKDFNGCMDRVPAPACLALLRSFSGFEPLKCITKIFSFFCFIFFCFFCPNISRQTFSIISSGVHIKIQFVFIGDGVELDLLKAKVKEYSLENVIFLKRCPPSEIGKIMTLAQVMLVHLSDNFLHEITIPSKIQAYMAVGRPILVAVKGCTADLAVQAGAGIRCEPENLEAIAEAACKIYQMPREELTAMGKKGQEYYKSKLSLKVGAKHYEEIFKQVTGHN